MSCFQVIEGKARIKTFRFVALISWSISDPSWTIASARIFSSQGIFVSSSLSKQNWNFRIFFTLVESLRIPIESSSYRIGLEKVFSIPMLRLTLASLSPILRRYFVPISSRYPGFGLALLCVGEVGFPCLPLFYWSQFWAISCWPL
jgi:hypothetical protein